MIVAIAANEQQKHALELKGFNEEIKLKWVSSSSELYIQTNADVWIDCLFDQDTLARIDKPLLIHAPIHTLRDMNAAGTVARFCAWNTFTERELWEIAVVDQNKIVWLQELMELMGWSYKLVNDQPGLIAPRVIGMIINEAYFALGEGISSKEEINIAMKLGTNYPYGPFEWASKIGHQNIYALLTKLAETDRRYQPSELMKG